MSQSWLWAGDQPLATLSPLDRGLAFGDGVFESIGIRAGRPILLGQHWARLALSCEQLEIPFWPVWHQLVDDCLAALPPAADGVLKLQVTRGVGGQGYASPADAVPTLIVSWLPGRGHPPAYNREGIAVTHLPVPLASNPRLAGIKHLNRLEQVLLRRELAMYPQSQEAIVCDDRGCVVEGVFSNVFAVLDDVCLTPIINACGVQGVMRNALLDALSDSSIRVQITDLPFRRLREVSEWFYCNSVYGIWPVTRWGNRTWQVGPFTRQCQAISAAWFNGA